MASAASRMAGKVGGPVSKIAGKAAESGSNPKNQEVLQKGAKRDPELYVCRPHRLGTCQLIRSRFFLL